MGKLLIKFGTSDGAARLEAQYRTPEMATVRAAVLRDLSPLPAERVLDIGCGPGFLALDLAAAVGAEGRVCGLDIAETMVGMSQKRCTEQPWAEFRTGDALQLPYGDGEFGAAAVIQVYEFVADLDKALAELFRVIRPGGRAAILDTDWATLTWNAIDRERQNRMLEAWRGQFADPRLPLVLAPRLKKAGFHLMHRDLVPHFTPEYNVNTYSAHLMNTIRNGIKTKEAQDWTEELLQLASEGAYFFSLNRYLFLIGKPQA